MYMADGGGAAIKDVAEGMSTIKKAAADGSFAVSQEGGQALIQAFDEMSQWVNHNLSKLRQLEQEPQLGSSHGANTLKPYVQKVASDNQGFLTMLLQFKDALEDGKQGVQAAMSNYRSTDDSAARSF